MISIQETIEAEVHEVLVKLGVDTPVSFVVERTERREHGDYATNVAMSAAKSLKTSPRELAEKLVVELKVRSDLFKDIQIAGAGFVNFFLTDEVVGDVLRSMSELVFEKRNESALFEYTDPNCFKVFHIGHLMANTIGESLSRLFEKGGYDVTRICYPSDIGLNVAKGVWGVMALATDKPDEVSSLKDKVAFLGKAYAYAHAQYEASKEAKQSIIEVNKAIYAGDNVKVMEVYAEGRALSLAYFDSLYQKLGTRFDGFIFESEVGEAGIAIVQSHLGDIFEVSEGATVYKGEVDGLHTRVFINSLGLPTYEAKDLGNYEKKLDMMPNASKYVVITASEQNDYFKVINKVEEKLHPELIGKLVHIGHGMLRLPEGKMSSRTGNVLGAEDLLFIIEQKLEEKFAEGRVEAQEKEKLIQDIAIGAMKFAVLRQSPGKDIIFDIDKSISFEGDSGPYLQYTHARIAQLLGKAEAEGVVGDMTAGESREREIELHLIAFKDVIKNAYDELGPHLIVEYLLELSRLFNSFYARQVIVNKDDSASVYYVALADKVRDVLAQGLDVLGIVAPERM